jgi:hypothetical protein
MKITFDENDAVDMIRGRTYVDALMTAGFIFSERKADGTLARFIGFDIHNPPRELIATDLLPERW